MSIDKKRKVLMLRSNEVNPDPRVQKEAEALLNAGYSVEVFCWDRSANHGLIEADAIVGDHRLHIYRTGISSTFGAGFRKNIMPLLRFQKDIIKFLLRNHKNYDVVHACDFDTCLTGYFCARAKGLKTVYDIFDYYADAFSVPQKLKKLIVRLDSYLINHSDAVIICSEQRLEQIKNTKPKRLAIIHNSPAKARLMVPDMKDENRDVLSIAYVGILNDGRLIPELLEAVSSDSNYRLDIAGYGKLESFVNEYSRKYPNIMYHGRVQYEKALELENGADVLMAAYDPRIPNHKYAAPNKYYEALMLGKPLIMCRNTGFSEELSAQGIGIYIDYSLESLQEGLREVNSRFDYYKKNGERGRELFDLNYNWEIMSHRLVELYSVIG